MEGRRELSLAGETGTGSKLWSSASAHLCRPCSRSAFTGRSAVRRHIKAYNQTKTTQGPLKCYSFKGFFSPLERIELVSNLNPLLDLFKQPSFPGLAFLALACFAG